MTVNVQVHIRPMDGQPHVPELNRLSNFLKVGVETAMTSITENVMAFDPTTGEPLYTAPYADPQAAALIEHMSVVSPSAYIGVLQSDYVDDVSDYLQIEPIIITPYFGDEDD